MPEKARPLGILEAVKKFGWPEPGSEIKSVELLIGEPCNARCLFCCAGAAGAKGGWRPFAELEAELARARRRGAWLVTLSGGEATLSPDLFRLAARARELGFKSVQVLTNGLKFASPAFARRAAAAGIDEVKVSLHGVDAATHDRLTGVPGSFAKAMLAFGNLNAAGIKASANFAVTRLNYRQMPLYARLVGGRLGLTGLCFMFSFYEGDMLPNSSRLSVRYGEVLPYLRLALEYIRRAGIKIESRMISNFTPCLAPEYENIMIDWGARGAARSGHVFKDGQRRRAAEFYAPRKAQLPACAGCAYADSCYGVDRSYVSAFGAGEFAAVPRRRRRFPLKPLYP